jgi:hypothetical protein
MIEVEGSGEDRRARRAAVPRPDGEDAEGDAINHAGRRCLRIARRVGSVICPAGDAHVASPLSSFLFPQRIEPPPEATVCRTRRSFG